MSKRFLVLLSGVAFVAIALVVCTFVEQKYTLSSNPSWWWLTNVLILFLYKRARHIRCPVFGV